MDIKNKQRGRLIAYYRKLSGLTQAELAARMDLSAKAISAWETGRNEPNMGQAYDLAKIFNIDVTELMIPPSEETKLKDELIRIVKAYENADDMTKGMVKRILKIENDSEYEIRFRMMKRKDHKESEGNNES